MDDALTGAVEEVERRTSYIELFFDLVFVFALTQVTSLIAGDTSGGGYARSTLLLALIWWAWSGYAWMTNAIELGEPLVRAAFLAALGGSFVMAIGVPGAYAEDGAWFAVPFFVVRILQVWLYAYGLRHDPAHQAAVLKLAPYFAFAPVLVLAGGFLDDPARVALWALAMVIDVGGTLAVGSAGFRVSPAHFAERYGLFVIIALGESIVAVGVALAGSERDALFALALVVFLVGVVAIWWAYFDFPASGVERALRRASPEQRGPVARDIFTLFHFPIVLGIIFFAVAAKKTVAHPDEALSGGGRVALGAGIAVFLIGFVLARYRAIRRVAWERLGAALAAALAVVVFPDLDALALMAVVLAILVAAIVLDTVHVRRFRALLRT